MHLSIHPCAHSCIHTHTRAFIPPSTRIPIRHPCAYPSFYLCLHPSTSQCTHHIHTPIPPRTRQLSMRTSIHAPVHASTYHLPIYVFIHPSINAPGRHSSTAYHIRRVCFLLIKLFAASTAIDHFLLWGTLSSLGSREGTFSWFHSYLSAPYMPKMEFPPLPPKCLSTGFFFSF